MDFAPVTLARSNASKKTILRPNTFAQHANMKLHKITEIRPPAVAIMWSMCKRLTPLQGAVPVIDKFDLIDMINSFD